MLEVINSKAGTRNIKFALFDFDGTISLIREGWQDVMKSYFFEEMKKTPLGMEEEDESIRRCIDEFVDVNTGKQTIYQCFPLVEELKKRGGKPQEALAYKDEYLRRLMEQIQHRIDGLERGVLNPLDYTVPGAYDFLKMLKANGVKMFLASGTDEEFAQHEADILGVSDYFQGKVYGAQRDYKAFSKKMVVERIIRNNHLHGDELLGVGDGFVEIENVKEAGGFTVGLASDEKNRNGEPDAWKRDRLIRAGADIIIPDFSNTEELEKYMFGKDE